MTFPYEGLLVPFLVDFTVPVDFLVRIIIVNTLETTDTRIISLQLAHLVVQHFFGNFYDETSVPVIRDLFPLPYVSEQDDMSFKPGALPFFICLTAFRISSIVMPSELMFNSGTLTSRQGGLGGSSPYGLHLNVLPTVSIGLQLLLGCFRLGFTRETSRKIIPLSVIIYLCCFFCFFCFILDVVSFVSTGAFVSSILLLEILGVSVLGII